MVAMDSATEDLPGQAGALTTLAHDDPRQALDAGQRLLDRPDLDGVARVTTLRAMATAAWLAGTVAESMEYANEALTTARRLHDAAAVAEATITMAGCQALGGDLDGALATLDSVAGHDPATTAKLDLQRLAVMVRAGRHAEAIVSASNALEAFRALGDEAMVAHCHANRGYALLELGRLAEAETDLAEAHRRYEELGLQARAAYTTHNLGILAHWAGDMPLALERFRASEALLTELTESPLEVQVSRCQALLSAGLLEEAVGLGGRIRAEMQRLGLALDEAEAALTVAQALVLLGDGLEAAETANEAAALFEHQGRPVWADRARLVAWTAQQAADRRIPLAEVARLATRLERRGLRTISAEARLLEIQGRLDRGDTVAARRCLDGLATTTLPLELQLRERLVTARVRLANNDRRGAAAAVRSGLRRLDRYRATLAASDLRAAVRRHGEELAGMGLSLGLEGGARAVLGWLERARAAALLAPPVQPPPDARLGSALAELRRVERELRRATTDDTALRRAQATLREEVTARSRERRGGRAERDPRASDLDRLVGDVGDRALFEVEIVDRRLVTVLVQAGRVRRLPDVDARTALHLGQGLAGSLRRVMLGRRGAAALTGAMAIAADLDEALPFVRAIDAQDVVLVTPGVLQGVPWAALPSLASRDVVVAPSATMWSRAVGGDPHINEVVVVAGPDLDHASAEARLVAARWPAPTLLAGDDARVDRVLGGLRGAHLAHLVCHGRFSPENALFSALRLADGDLTVHELEDVVPPPHTVVLSSCEAGVVSDRPGAELLGLSSALLATGTRCLIAPVTVVPDLPSTVDAMVLLHERLAAGESPARALATCRRAAQGDPVAVATTSAYTCFGRGDVSQGRPLTSG